MSARREVANAQELLDATVSDATEIEVRGTISGMPMITLKPGVTLCGGVLEFGAKGVRLTSQNTLDGVTIHTALDEVALLNDTSVEDLGTLTLRSVTTVGQVLLLADHSVRAGRVVAPACRSRRPALSCERKWRAQQHPMVPGDHDAPAALHP